MKVIQKNGSVFFLALFLVACGPSAEEIAATYVVQTAKAATNTPVPTVTNTPTSTPSPSMTPSPTMTPTIAPPSPISNLLENPRLTFYDIFYYIEVETWNTQACQTVSNIVNPIVKTTN